MAEFLENALGWLGSGEGFGGPSVFANVAGNGVLEIRDGLEHAAPDASAGDAEKKPLKAPSLA